MNKKRGPYIDTHTEILYVRISPKVKKYLKTVGKQRGMTMSGVARMIMLEDMNRELREKAGVKETIWEK